MDEFFFSATCEYRMRILVFIILDIFLIRKIQVE